jgi:hypothetical protein
MKVFDHDDYNHLPDSSEPLPCPERLLIAGAVFYLSSRKIAEEEEIRRQIAIFR